MSDWTYKRTVFVTEMDDGGNVNEQYDMDNSASSWEGFRAGYAVADAQIALEVSTTGKYVAGGPPRELFHRSLNNRFNPYCSQKNMSRRGVYIRIS